MASKKKKKAKKVVKKKAPAKKLKSSVTNRQGIKTITYSDGSKETVNTKTGATGSSTSSLTNRVATTNKPTLQSQNAGYSTTNRLGETTYYASSKDAPGYNDTQDGKNVPMSPGTPLSAVNSVGEEIDPPGPTDPNNLTPNTPLTPEGIAKAVTEGMGQNATGTTPDQQPSQAPQEQQTDTQGNVLPDSGSQQQGVTSSQGGSAQAGTPLSNPSVVDYLNSTGQPSDFASRRAMAERLGISGYTGTAAQNQQLLSSARGIPVAPTETLVPTSAGVISQTSNTAPVSSTQSLITNADKFGLTQTKNDFQTDPIKTIKDITKQVFSAMGLDQANKEIKNIAKELEDLQNKKDDEIRAINDDPWLTEGVRQRQIQKADEKWADRIDSRVNKLQLLESVQKDAVQQAQFALGTAISLYDSERRFQAAQTQMYYDQAQQEFDNAIKLQELSMKGQGGSGTSEMQEYMFSVDQGFNGSFMDYKQAIAAAGRAPSSGGGGGLSAAQINATVNSIAGAFDNEAIVKEYNTIRRNLETYNNLGTSATDDIQRVYTFAKVADPNSAVKEGEYASIEKYAQAVAQRAGLQLSRVFSPTGILTPEARTAMGLTLQTSLNASQSSYNQIQSEYQRQIDAAYSGQPRQLTQYTPPQNYGPVYTPPATQTTTPTKDFGVIGNALLSLFN